MGQIKGVDKAGELFLEAQEGVVHHVYLDDAGNPTGGCGHKLTALEIKKYPVGTPLPQDQIDTWMELDGRMAENCINTLVTVNLNQNQYDALWSLVFNIGWGNFKKSGQNGLLAAINNDASPQLIEVHWLAWGKEKGIQKPSLYQRRLREFDFFIKPVK